MRSPTLSTIEAKVAELKACKNKEYTYEEVQKLVEGERKSNKMKGNFALRKIELRTQIEHMQEKAAEWALHVSNFNDGQEEGPSSVDPDKTPVPFTPEQIAAKEAELKALDGKQDLEKQIEQKTKLAQSYRIDDINVRFPSHLPPLLSVLHPPSSPLADGLCDALSVRPLTGHAGAEPRVPAPDRAQGGRGDAQGGH
jgi:hypothetical protein